ncbi:alpha/beta fold hydrolase [Henriciella aquimarina]|uniref:alpha/beta fold hydrolase n=1 Tax=Henriciella aquimarina TaxID=545261 RepID=UPI000A059ED7|nr:alpha/beta fold hydrolase [Henriciella aquimarina]
MVRKLAAIILTLVAVLAAGWLALRRPDIPYETLESTYSVAGSKFTTLGDDVKVHYVDTGPRDAPVLMLVHGYAASLHTWLAWRDVLDDNYRIVMLDLPGHGLSRTPEDKPVSIGYYTEIVDQLADRLDIDRFSLAGSSMGGNVAWRYALDHPDRLDSLVLVDAAGWPPAEGEADQAPLVFKLLRFRLARLVIKDLDMSRLIEDGLRKSFADPSFVTSEMAERYSALSRAPGHRQALLSLAAGGPKRMKASRERLGDLSVPTLILWGQHDNLVPVAHAKQFEEAIPNAVAIIYDEAGHIPQEELAVQSAGDVRAFLDRTASSDQAGRTETVSEAAAPQQATGGGARPR